MPRTIAIGDVHGCLPALEALLSAIRPRPDDTTVTLGDYIDRGPQTRGVIDRLLELRRQCRLVALLGNHEEMMLQVVNGRSRLYTDWLLFGGEATLDSYNTRRPEEVPAAHVDFLRGCLLTYETERCFFVHGSYLADRPLDDQPREVLLWDSIKHRLPGPHLSGKTAIVGHASQHSGEVLDLGYLKCIDTWCYGDGRLTALDVDGGQLWQADKNGRMRGE
ncbi:MAG: serine/threonine protein phosphatase [Pirellulales bacterium]|nr:serine/threonine protein phosphatase [Pirellulales bacterium]